jgi:hypothetical protein
MHPQAEAFDRFIKKHVQMQAELETIEERWQVFRHSAEELHEKIQAFILNIIHLKRAPDAALYVPLINQATELMIKSTTFYEHMTAYYKLHESYYTTLNEMLDKITAEKKKFNALKPGQSLKNGRAIENKYMPEIIAAAQKINEMVHQLTKECTQVRALYNSLKQ